MDASQKKFLRLLMKRIAEQIKRVLLSNKVSLFIASIKQSISM